MLKASFLQQPKKMREKNIKVNYNGSSSLSYFNSQERRNIFQSQNRLCLYPNFGSYLKIFGRTEFYPYKKYMKYISEIFKLFQL
jgi:hypothetical protein